MNVVRIYNDPAGGEQSSIGNEQFNQHYYERAALEEAAKEQYFSQLSGVKNMPKHMGKKIKKYHYLPLLDDQNINDQGIDAAGAVITNNWEVIFKSELASVSFAVEADADALVADLTGAAKSGAGPYTVTFAEPVSNLVVTTEALAVSVQNTDEGAGAIVRRMSGNLYGSSKDIGVVTSKMPLLSETGGRVNRVGFRRKEIEGTLHKMGFFEEYTQESLDFDSDAELEMHIHREMVLGANEMTEDLVQADLLNNAGVLRYAGDATIMAELDAADKPTYGDFLRLSITLDNNRCPKKTKIITGTRLTDTKVIPACRVMFVGSEVLPMLEEMKDLHDNQAFIKVEKYAAGTTVLRGEEGSIGKFRIVVVPEMMRWAGAGADASGTSTHYETGNRYDVFPMLVVGDESFTNIGFQTDGKQVKFTIYHKKPGEEMANRDDPFGELGFMSIKWYHGVLIERPERIALMKTAAPM